jgi:uncharacterized protein (TIGR00288 family)
MEETQVAVFIDFENIAISAEEEYGRCDLEAIMKASAQWGRGSIRRAYCDWTGFSQYQQDLIAHSVELTQLFRYSPANRKNAADIQMVVDALETSFTHPEIDVFVLVTGDSDFSAVARKLRSYGKTVVGIGLRRSTSEVLVKACDHFILYDTLIESDTRTMSYRTDRARQLLVDAMRTLLHQNGSHGSVSGGPLKMMMLQLDPTFNEGNLGFHQFRNFLEAQSDLVQVIQDNKEIRVQLVERRDFDATQEELFRYRGALMEAGLRLMDPHTRNSVLQDLYQLLTDSPGSLTLDIAVMQLKARYDAENVLRSREEVQEVAKLLRYADVWVDRPQSWNLDPLTVRSGLDRQAFVDRCESVYISVLLQKNLNLELDRIALLLFGTLDQQTRAERLARLARQSLNGEARVSAVDRPAQAQDGVCILSDAPELGVVYEDLGNVVLDEPASVERAAALNSRGLHIRTTDFEQARGYFLKAARMACDLLKAEAPGASRMDLGWYLASYCAASAGACYYRSAYDQALTYYLAFFALAQETQPVWEKIHNLVEPMVSFYFSVAASANGEMLELAPGRTHPARIAAALANYPNPVVREQWTRQAADLRRVNPAVLRTVLQRLDIFERTTDIPGVGAARQVLRGVLTPV